MYGINMHRYVKISGVLFDGPNLKIQQNFNGKLVPGGGAYKFV